MCPLSGVPKSQKANTAFRKLETLFQSSKYVDGTCEVGR